MSEVQTSPVVSIGECMVELARGPDGRYGLSYGGDTFNTAVYLAREGIPVTYATQLGDDPYSSAIVALAELEGIATGLMARLVGRMPGLYLIGTDAEGERTFHYWRDRSPARELFDGESAGPVISAMATARLVYFSGVTLSLYGAAALDRFEAALAEARTRGVLIAMDSNYRPRGWAGDKVAARKAFERFWRLSDIALPTFADEAALWGDPDAAATSRRLLGLGAREVALKLGAGGALVASEGQALAVPCPEPIIPVDTTSAGDSFNAA
jgi:2-dehydro-3-deoxygluconokinase